MSNKFDRYAKGAKDYFGPQYDSDEDLPEDVQNQIEKADIGQKQQIRDKAWDNVDFYPKLKRMVKGAFYGDKRKKQD